MMKSGRSLNIGFVSTRFQGLDGVSLEASKWAAVLEELGHRCFWFAGRLDRDPRVSFLAPEAFFGHAAVAALTADLFCRRRRSRGTTDALHRQKELLKDSLYSFMDGFRVDLLIVENALSIPMHLPLGMALTEVIAETGTPTIAHHHDFSWERARFRRTACQDILAMAFPPDLPSIEHVVINSLARADLAARRGIAAHLVPNVLDFDAGPPAPPALSTREVRASLGFRDEEVIVLQPTRVVPRKGIELAVDLVKLLDLPGVRLVVSHAEGDEGDAYGAWVRAWADRQGVALSFVHDRLRGEDAPDASGRALISLSDLYMAADLVTFPSLVEGFGNALLEAVYYGKPLLVNRYSVFIADIEPLGFDVVAIDGTLTADAVGKVKAILADPVRRAAAAARNFDLGRRCFSFNLLRRELARFLSILFGGGSRP
jgi:glycosyltransferase involved in cell wall biosynthesis